jgi:outer membrane autotransporter protein
MEHLLVDAGIIKAYSNFEAVRKIEFSTIERRARNHHSGSEVSSYLNLGAPFDIKKVTVTPFLSGDWVYLHESSFNEKGAKSLNLEVKDKNYTYLRGEFGLDLRRCITFNKDRLVPFIKISGIREVRSEGSHYTAQLRSADEGYFTVRGMNPTRWLVSPGAGFNAILDQERVNFSIRYDGEFGEHFSDNIISGQVTYRF